MNVKEIVPVYSSKCDGDGDGDGGEFDKAVGLLVLF